MEKQFTLIPEQETQVDESGTPQLVKRSRTTRPGKPHASTLSVDGYLRRPATQRMITGFVRLGMYD